MIRPLIPAVPLVALLIGCSGGIPGSGTTKPSTTDAPPSRSTGDHQSQTGVSAKPDDDGTLANQILLSENWESGSVDAEKWYVNNMAVVVAPPGGANHALRGKLSDSNFYAKAAFQRGDNLRVTFRYWFEPRGAANSLRGPWHSAPGGTATPDGGVAGRWDAAGMLDGEAIEEGTGDPTHYWQENNQPSYDNVRFDRRFDQRMYSCNSYETSILLRVTLGDTAGGMVEYSDDGKTWIVVKQRDSLDALDSRKLAAGDLIAGSTMRVSATSPVYFGAWPNAGAVGYFDDIIIEKGPIPETATVAEGDVDYWGNPTKDSIGYIRDEIPDFDIPAYLGERYEDLVPDTLDVAERAKLAIIGLTRMTDPDADYSYTAHYFIYAHVQPKWYESLPLMRIITGSSKNDHVDRAWMETILKSIGPDGLHYTAVEGRRMVPSGWAPKICWPDGTVTRTEQKPFSQMANTTTNSRVLTSMLIYYLRDNNPMWKETIDRMVDRWSELATERGDYAFYPVASFVPNATVTPSIDEPKGILASESSHRLVQSLALYHNVTRNPKARRLAERLSHYVRNRSHYFDENGRFADWENGRLRVSEGDESGAHTHAHAIALLSLVEHALSVGDRDLAQFVNTSFEWIRDHEWTSSLTGWVPEILTPDRPNCEACTIADLIGVALKLTDMGVGDHWDTVDRWVRNQFFEQQMSRPDLINDPNYGGWTAASTGCDHGGGSAGCCTGNSTRVVYYIWQHILDFRDGTLRLNLLLNRASKWADVYSHIPYSGRVDIRLKRDCAELLVRVPEWIESESDDISCVIDGAEEEFEWSGRYVQLKKLVNGQEVTVTFPIQERTVKETVGGVDYTYIVRGNTVVSVDPPGKKLPLYQREHYRKSDVRWHKVERFVPDDDIRW